MPLSFSARIPDVRSLFRRGEPVPDSSSAPATAPGGNRTAPARSSEELGREAVAERSRLLSSISRGLKLSRPTGAAPDLSKASAEYVERTAPGLHRQMEALCQSGWQIAEKHLEHGSASRLGNKKIEIDPRIARGGRMFPRMGEGVATGAGDIVFKKGSKRAYLCELAHQVGCAAHQEPISLQTSVAFVEGSLLRTASGVWNELQTRREILAQGGKDIWSRRGPEFQALIAIHDRNHSSGDEAVARREIAATLKNMPVHGNNVTYGQAFAQQYGAFQISDKTGPEVIAHVQACFNETGVALPADRIAVHGHAEGGLHHWMTDEHLRKTLLDHGTRFQGKGIRNEDVGQSIMAAVTGGVKAKHAKGAEWHLHTYYDPKQRSVLGMYIKPGKKPGEVVDAVICEQVAKYAVRKDGRVHTLNMSTAYSLIPSRAPAFRGHGIPDQEIPAAVMTAMAAGTKLPHESHDDWSVYEFEYRGSPSKLKLKVRQDTDGNIQEFEMAPKATAPTSSAVATPTRLGGIDEVLASEEGAKLKEALDVHGMDSRQFLATVVQPENRKRFSLEYPGFGVYRADINGLPWQILARMEKGQIADIRSPMGLDALFRHAPNLEKQYETLQRNGWDFRLGTPGGGTYCTRELKTITIDSMQLGDPCGVMRALAHEIGHAVYPAPPLSDSEEDYVISSAMDEGAATLSEFKVMSEIVDPMVKKNYEKFLAVYGAAAADICAKWKADCEKAKPTGDFHEADDDASKSLGELYKNFRGSTDPDGVTYEQVWRNRYRLTKGKQSPEVLMKKLETQTPRVQIWNAAGKWNSPSFESIQVIRHLPKQSDVTLPDSIFISKEVFHRAAKNVNDADHLDAVIRNALSFGNFDLVEATPPGTETAVCSYTKSGQPYAVRFDFDKHGQVFDFKVGGPGFPSDAGVMLSELAPHRLPTNAEA